MADFARNILTFFPHMVMLLISRSGSLSLLVAGFSRFSYAKSRNILISGL